MSEQVDDFLAHYGVKGMKWDKRKDDDKTSNKKGDGVGDFLAHYGVLGMKWGVRKDRSGKLRQKTTMTPDQRKNPNNALAEGVDQSVMGRNNRIMDKSSPGMKKQIKILNNRPEYKNSDLTKDPVLRKKYNKEMSTAIASVYLKNSMALKHPNEDLILKLHPDVITDGRETMDFYISETSGMFHETVSPDGLIEFKDVVFDYDKSVKHSDSSEVIVGRGTISLEYNALGHIIDAIPPTKLAHSDDVDDFLAHYGVLGMKWGVRKDPVTGKRRPTKQVLADQKRRSKKEEAGSRKSNRLSDNPQNRNISDDELRKIIGRLQMEKQYAQLTAKQTAPPSRVKTLVKDVAYDVVKGATTEAGKSILTQALKVQFNKRASGDYKVPIKVLNEIKDKVSN